jgi:peptide/histidine transporter 3/4
MLQRIGTGLALSTFAMGVAALVEMKRLRVIEQHGLEDEPAGVPLPMSIFWLLPQYIVFGVSEIFVILGQIEFFYDQAPDEMPSIGTALYTSNTGVAHFLCTAILQIVTSATSRKGGSGWIVNNLNRCRIDKWYWTLAALGVVNLLCYVAVARWYTYKMVVRRF